MVILRILLLAGLLLAVYFLVRKIKWVNTRKKPAKQSRMVACEYCGVFIPGDEAIVSGNKNYCCQAHKDSISGN